MNTEASKKLLSSSLKVHLKEIQLPPGGKEEKGTNEKFLEDVNRFISSVLHSRYPSGVLTEEKKIVNIVKSCPPEHQYVCFKLFAKPPKWHNLYKYCKAIESGLNDKEVNKLFKFLVSNNMVETSYRKDNMAVILNLLDTSNVEEICQKFKLQINSKSRMIQMLQNHCDQPSTNKVCKITKEFVWTEIVKRVGKTVIKIKNKVQKCFFHICVLGTLANPKLYNKWNYFEPLVDLRNHFPDYTVEDHVIFYSRSEFLSYAKACECKDKCKELIKSKNHIQLIQMGKNIFQDLKDLGPDKKHHKRYDEAPHLERFTARSVYIYILTDITDTLKSKFSLETRKWMLYLIRSFPKSHQLGDWYLHVIDININYLQRPEVAANKVLDALERKRRNLTEVQIEYLREKADELLKNNVSQLMHDSLVEFLPDLDYLDQCPRVIVDENIGKFNGIKHAKTSKHLKSVEKAAMHFYFSKRGYTDGDRCKYSMIVASFALFFWDIIYNPKKLVPGSFISKFQRYPIDMYTIHFYANRKEAVEKRLNDIAEDWPNERMVDFIDKNWNSYSHQSGIRTIDGRIPSKTYLKEIVKCIGRKKLSKIYERLLKDLECYKNGMPDLLFWNTKDKKALFVIIVEENVKLSIEQRLWVKYFKSIEVNIEICSVVTVPKKTMKSSAQKQEEVKAPVKRAPPENIKKSDTNEATQSKKRKIEDEFLGF